jgi:hypothetical protein
MKIKRDELKNEKIKNEELIQKVIKLVDEERRIGVEILELLSEIELRKAYSEIGYDGLFSFCVKELNYSEAQAYRRIQAMRAMKEIPELKQKIKDGILTVTTVSQVQTHLAQQKRAGENFSTAEKFELFESVQNQSAKKVENTLKELAGTPEGISLTLKLTPELAALWSEVKNLSAHSTRGQVEEIFKMLLQAWLKKNRMQEEKPNKSNKVAMEDSVLANAPGFLKKEELCQSDKINESPLHDQNHHAGSSKTNQKTNVFYRSRYIPAQIKKFVWSRDEGKCTNCGSKHALQFDHRIPFSKNGKSEANNLRLLCRSCNLQAGIKLFGLEKMKRTTSARVEMSVAI